ncbi:MAG: hypothetical protein M1832_000528 [Thelocarpon impressellum]|nr:MAG: hypothetical protein M1832_000528 [Thelocarpon impressellum]
MTPTSGALRPITPREFLNALYSVWRPANGRSGAVRPLVGLAVSGGADSMALAYLCRCLPQERQDFKAFVVDHRARAGSRREAEVTSAGLRRIGLPSAILRLKWPDGVSPTELSNFETEARRLRYQALGQACHQEGISALLLAHHEDDQAETVLLRLANGHAGSGLQGMRSGAEIPECNGMYGVHMSGGSDLPSRARRLEQIEIEKGGVKIYRPLLRFPKDRLRETCLASSTRWREDPSNADASLTPRNAVRQLLAQGRLPASLQKPSLMDVARRTRERDRARDGHGLRLFKACDILAFDTLVGSATVRMPAISNRVPEEGDLARRSLGEKRRQAMRLLERLVGMVTPVEKVRRESLGVAVAAIWPELALQGEGKGLQSFTVAGVHFTGHPPNAGDSNKGEEARPTFTFVRAPPPRNRPIQPLPITPSTWYKPQFVLWDNRFWISLWSSEASLAEVSFVVRAYAPGDAAPLLSSLPSDERDHLLHLLKTHAKGKSRWTLPAVVAETGGLEEVVALPTLDIYTPRADEWGIQCQVRFRSVGPPEVLRVLEEVQDEQMRRGRGKSRRQMWRRELGLPTRGGR